jgi:hypothetical protein
MIHPMLFLVVALGYAIACFLLGLYTDTRNSDDSKASFGSFELPLNFSYGKLFVLSLLGLYFEMLMIRWLSSEIRIFAYYKNLVLIACFLGFGLGCALCRRRVHPLATAMPLLLFTFFVAAPLPGMHDAVVNLTALIGMSSQVQIWGVANPNTLNYTALAAALVAVASLFACVVFTFVPIGQVVGAMLETAPRGPRAYTINVAGSLAGILLYTLICFFYQPPAMWFLVGAVLFGAVFLPQRKAVLIFFGSCILVAAALTVWVSKTSRVYWSPYQKLALTPVGSNGEIVAYWLNTNDSFYQQVVNLSPDFLERHRDLLAGEDTNWNPYNIPYRFMSSPRSVLALGAGMGNDVAAALRNTNAQVTAVEIDPLILKLGEILHFERPYQSPRVRIINDDARSYIQNSRDKFDLILFSLLDSHTTASSYSNIRIDNFVYTREAIARARDMLNPDGLMIVKFQVDNDWVGDRLSGLIQQAFHQAPFQAEGTASRYGTGGNFYIIGSGGAMRQISQNAELVKHVSLARESHATLTTDDWPYFYQKERGLPAAILGMGGFLMCLSWYMIRRMTGHRRSGGSPMWNLHFFLLGAGFMLLEAQVVSKMALLFGTTWVVNSIVVSGLLALVVIANLIFERWPSYSLAIPYAGIILSAMLAYFVPLQTLLFESVGLRITVATLLLCMPILFAGMVFVRSFADMRFSGEALGWNLFGAVLGGMLETLSQATGIRALILITVGLYLGSWIARNKAGAARTVDTGIREEEVVLAESR